MILYLVSSPGVKSPPPLTPEDNLASNAKQGVRISQFPIKRSCNVSISLVIV